MDANDKDLVTVHLLIYNHKPYLKNCIDSVLRQNHKPLEFLISDNNSSDGSAEFVSKNYPFLTLLKNNENLGYSRGHDQIIERSKAAYFMPLNPDAVLTEKYVQELVRAIKADKTVGMATGKLYRDKNKIIDSTGIIFTPTLRHLDRGSNKKDIGQFDQYEYVFGVSGAAPLFKMEMLQNIKIMGEYFDHDFFSYREDADLCWRAQLLGWKAVYSPFAVAYHKRRVSPSNRRYLPEEINIHSIKNRFLMRAKNLTWGVGLKTFPFFIWRDILLLGYVLLVEHSSLKAFLLLAKSLPRAMEKRKLIMKKVAVRESYLCHWFSWKTKGSRLVFPSVSSSV